MPDEILRVLTNKCFLPRDRAFANACHQSRKTKLLCLILVLVFGGVWVFHACLVLFVGLIGFYVCLFGSVCLFLLGGGVFGFFPSIHKLTKLFN